MHFARMANTLLKDEESTRDDYILLVTLPNIYRLKKLRNKPFLIWLLTTPPHLKYVATIHCSLWLIDCFADTDVSQGSVATYTRCGVGFEYQFNYKFTTESYSEIFIRLRFDRNNGHESVSSLFWPIL